MTSRVFLWAVCICVLSAAGLAAVTEDEVRAQFETWNTALIAKDLEGILDLYAEESILLPTLSNVVRDTRELKEDYFVNDFFPKNPSGTITEDYVTILSDDVVIYNGKYDFATSSNGKPGVSNARFSYVYQRDAESGEWKIVTHHSSLLPEPLEPASPTAAPAAPPCEEAKAGSATSAAVGKPVVMAIVALVPVVAMMLA